jgi:hypothetical protein
MLEKLRFEVKDTHHKIAWFTYQGEKILKTRRSHGRGDIPTIILNRIRQQMELTSRQFDNALSCPLTYDNYVDILREKGLITTHDQLVHLRRRICAILPTVLAATSTMHLPAWSFGSYIIARSAGSKSSSDSPASISSDTPNAFANR